MPDTPVISKVKLNNTEYDIKDADARSRLTTAETKLSGIEEGATVDDHKWGGVELAASGANTAADAYVPSMESMSNTSGTARWARATITPTNYAIAKYDGNAQLKSTTPTAGDSSTKVATTAFVGNAISSLGSVLNYKGTKTTVSALPSTGNIVGDVWIVTADNSEWVWDGSSWEELGQTVDLSGYAELSDLPTAVSDLTNDSGYLTLATLPVYDGTVIIDGTTTDYATMSDVDEATTIAYSATLSSESWSGNAAPYTYQYINSSLMCGKNGDVSPIIINTSNDLEYPYIYSASATAGQGIVFSASQKPANNINITIIDIA